VASGDWSGERTPNGIESIGPLTMAAEFVLTCAGAGGSVLASERVDVLEPSGDDTDGDGLPDEWERVYFGSLDRDGGGDPDADGLSNADELDARTDPTLWDSDDDGSGDAEELYYGSDPRDASDVWTAHRPMQPQVADADEVALRGGILDTQAAYQDPDGTPLGYAEWQLGTDDSFVELVLGRTVLGAVTLEIPAGVLDRSSTYWARTRHVDTTGLPSIWSEARRVTTASAFPNDADGDDVDDDYQVSGFADANADGIDDAAQGLCNLYDAEGRSIIGFGSSSGRIRCFTSIANRELPGGDAYADQLDYGMFAFAIDGLEENEASPATVRVTIYLPEAPTPLSSWYKYDEANGEITDYGAYSTISGEHMLLTLIDGGAGDQDGVVNGVIVDPSGPAIAAMPPPPNGGGGGGGDGDGDREPAPGGGKEQDEGGGGGASSPLFLFLLWRAVTRRRARGACAPRVS
jgi:hypothetical protein